MHFTIISGWLVCTGLTLASSREVSPGPGVLSSLLDARRPLSEGGRGSRRVGLRVGLRARPAPRVPLGPAVPGASAVVLLLGVLCPAESGETARGDLSEERATTCVFGRIKF